MMMEGSRFQVGRTDLGELEVWESDAHHAFAHMVDAGPLDKLTFYLQSLADRLVTFTVIGSDQEVGRALNSAVFIGDPQALPPGSGPDAVQAIATISLNLSGGDWHPWLGLVITTRGPGPSNGGVVKAWAVHRQWVAHKEAPPVELNGLPPQLERANPFR